MIPNLEAKLEQVAQDQCYTGEHMHALRLGAQLASEEMERLVKEIEAALERLMEIGADSW
jgi:hypothetical protein